MVGLGHFSTDLLPPAVQLTKNCYLAAIVTGTPAKAESWKTKFNIPDKNIFTYENFDSIKGNPDIDVVYVVWDDLISKQGKFYLKPYPGIFINYLF